MSMLLTGGGLAHGQVVGSTDARGGEVKETAVTPSDLGATVFRHLGIYLNSQWIDPHGGTVDRHRRRQANSGAWIILAQDFALLSLAATATGRWARFACVKRATPGSR